MPTTVLLIIIHTSVTVAKTVYIYMFQKTIGNFCVTSVFELVQLDLDCPLALPAIVFSK